MRHGDLTAQRAAHAVRKLKATERCETLRTRKVGPRLHARIGRWLPWRATGTGPSRAAGATSRRGPTAGPSHNYHLKQLRDAEKVIVEQQERAYEVIVAHWQPQKPKKYAAKR